MLANRLDAPYRTERGTIPCMKRRRFFKTMAALPAAPALFSQTQQSPPTPAANARPARPGGANVPAFEETAPELAGDPAPKFFTAEQFTALRKLSDLLVPPMKGNPGAVECQAPEFLDFLLGASSQDRQSVYRNGLDGLNAAAKKRFKKAFADLDSGQADEIVRPFLVAVAWAYDLPKDPMQRFLFEAHRDIRIATQNSRKWATAGAAAGRRGFGGGQYLKPIDPIYRS